ncbi:MAG TPA: amino acid adenylation domain-containing protein [Actinomycetota bacterium]|nr:amino acid adenylation domain-containing protein [Actinomycetota bacterium]
MDELIRISRAWDVPPSVTVLAGLEVLLARYADADRVVVGVRLGAAPTGHDPRAVPPAVVPVGVDLADDPPFAEAARRAMDVISRGVVSPGASPKEVEGPWPVEFDVPGHAAEFDRRGPGGDGLGRAVAATASDADLAFSVEEQDRGLEVRVGYRADLFDPESVDRILGHLHTLIHAAVASPLDPVSSLPLLTDEERRLMVVDWNATSAPYSSGRCLHELIEEQVARTPEAVAVELDGDVLSYGELNAAANRLAHALAAMEVGPGTIVGLCVERSFELIVATLAILKAGGTYVPLDPAYPPERLAFMIADTGASLLVTQHQVLPNVPAHIAHIVLIDPVVPGSGRADPGNLESRVRPDDLAYVIYTSGSTGKPKGVMAEHRSVVNFLEGMLASFGLGRSDVMLALSSMSFDPMALEVYLPLFVGGRVAMVSGEDAVIGRRIAARIEGSGATVVQGTPTTWRMLLESGFEGRAGLRIVSGGEVLTSALAAALLRRGAELWNVYGPTETTVWCTLWRVDARDSPVPIGRQIQNTALYILDRRGRLLPIGVTGELYVGGAGVARGYLNRPELTAERFLPDPFAGVPGARMYRTGDLARCRADGTLDFVGRLDDQVKVRGYRIELGEIEVTLAEHPQVLHAVAVAPEDATGERRLIAYVVTREPRPPTPLELRQYLRRLLPSYMVPSAVVIVRALPRTSSGKIDRGALPLLPAG